MTAPNYSLSRAKMEGRDAASTFIQDRKGWPMTQRPENPYVMRSIVDDDLKPLHEAWQESFDTTLKAFEALIEALRK